MLSDGKPVRDARTWSNRRRPEIIRQYESVIYGRIPSRTPTVHWRVVETDLRARGGAAVMKSIVGAMGEAPIALGQVVDVPEGTEFEARVIWSAT